MAPMFRKLGPIALVLTLAAGAALAQEYGRASGGQLDLITKQPSQFSGSLGMTRSRSSLFGNSFNGFGATAGGTLVSDRLWFFGSLQRNDALPASAGSVKFNANLGDRQTLSAMWDGLSARPDGLRTRPTLATPAWFGTMHYTGIISPSSFFTASVSQSVAH